MYTGKSQNLEYVGLLEPTTSMVDLPWYRQPSLNLEVYNRLGQKVNGKEYFTWLGGELYIRNDGKRYIEASNETTDGFSPGLRFYDEECKELEREGNGYDFGNAKFGLTPDDRRFIVAHMDGVTAYNWDGKIEWEYGLEKTFYDEATKRRLSRSVNYLVISPGGKYIIAEYSESDSIYLGIKPGAYKPDLKYLGGGKYTLFLDGEGKLIRKVASKGRQDPYTTFWGITFSPNDEKFLAGAYGKLFIYEMPNLNKTLEFSIKDKERLFANYAKSASRDWNWYTNIELLGLDLLKAGSKVVMINASGETLWEKSYTEEDI